MRFNVCVHRLCAPCHIGQNKSLIDFCYVSFFVVLCVCILQHRIAYEKGKGSGFGCGEEKERQRKREQTINIFAINFLILSFWSANSVFYDVCLRNNASSRPTNITVYFSVRCAPCALSLNEREEKRAEKNKNKKNDRIKFVLLLHWPNCLLSFFSHRRRIASVCQYTQKSVRFVFLSHLFYLRWHRSDIGNDWTQKKYAI